ncbi:MAG: histidinol-phosphatase [Cyclobacteriaceae bacterium]
MSYEKPTTPILRLLFVLVLLTGCTVKQTDNRKWYKGNLHTHSYWSDGDEYPEMIMDWYKSNEYNFIALSDHNILAEGTKWITVRKSRIYELGFEKYLEKFGKDWVTYKTDTGRIQVKLKTFKEYKPLFEDDNFLILQSEEISDRTLGKPIHMNVTNIQTLIPLLGGENVTEVMQRYVDAVLKQRKETGVPMFPHINHPNYFYAVTAQDIIDLKGERFFEVYSGHPKVNNYGDSLHPGLENMWDMINIAYHKKNQPFLYGLGTDDSHHYHLFGNSYSNAGRGWVMVLADSLSPGSLIKAMEAGNFYATSGVIMEEVAVADKALHIKVREEPGVNYEIQFIGATAEAQHSRILKTISGPEASIELLPEFIFVRAKITSDKLKENPFQEGDYETAWTQPLSGKL